MCDEQPPKRAAVFVGLIGKQNDFTNPETEHAGSYTESRIRRTRYVTVISPAVFFNLQ